MERAWNAVDKFAALFRELWEGRVNEAIPLKNSPEIQGLGLASPREGGSKEMSERA